MIHLMDIEASPPPIEILLENHRAFLRYLERRVGDRALAEDILQDAFARIVAPPEQAPRDESIVPWFYRTLRNAAIDQFRRRGAADRAYEAFARELETPETPTPGDGDRDLHVRLSSHLNTETGIRRGTAGHRGRRQAGQGVCRREAVVAQQRGGPCVPRARGTQGARHGIVRHMRRARVR